MTNKINGIDVSEYFVNHYDSSGKLYAVEYKGNPLELQNAIKYLQKENEEFKKRCEEWALETVKKQGAIDGKDFRIDKYKQALEEIKTFAKPIKENTCFGMYCGFVDFVLEQCNEVLNEQNIQN